MPHTARRTGAAAGGFWLQPVRAGGISLDSWCHHFRKGRLRALNPHRHWDASLRVAAGAAQIGRDGALAAATRRPARLPPQKRACYACFSPAPSATQGHRLCVRGKFVAAIVYRFSFRARLRLVWSRHPGGVTSGEWWCGDMSRHPGGVTSGGSGLGGGGSPGMGGLGGGAAAQRPSSAVDSLLRSAVRCASGLRCACHPKPANAAQRLTRRRLAQLCRKCERADFELREEDRQIQPADRAKDVGAPAVFWAGDLAVPVVFHVVASRARGCRTPQLCRYDGGRRVARRPNDAGLQGSSRRLEDGQGRKEEGGERERVKGAGGEQALHPPVPSLSPTRAPALRAPSLGMLGARLVLRAGPPRC